VSVLSIRPLAAPLSATAKWLSSWFTAARLPGLSNRQPVFEPDTVQPSPGVPPWALPKLSDSPFQPYPGAVQAVWSAVSRKSRLMSLLLTVRSVSCWT